MKEKVKVVTDSPSLTGYLHDLARQDRRETSDSKQQGKYEDGYRRGARDSCK
ncbi:hypothetical protein ACE1AT_04790 [Pelatocladus sp. BLCC-F211]|uniref:hypothetical protein n=1 Tax=Pelatocladus sp. BLCC-F211 TaxID=3342752 RepID=UPI0035B959EE